MNSCSFNVIIAGSRTLSYEEYSYEFLYNLVINVIKEYLPLNVEQVTIISGGAKGADLFGEKLAEDSGYEVKRFIPKWQEFREGDPVRVNKRGDKYNPLAGMRRNEEMGKVGDLLIALWDLKSTGTKHMIETMKKASKPSVIITI